jgi:citrate lyase subunit beta/citryl-CoA lyase
VMRAYEIASASPRVIAVALGLEDYLADIRAERTSSGTESAWAEGQVVNAARAAGISPLASVFSKVDDDAGMLAYSERARSRGFDGVGCIHPRQVPIAHQGFGPSEIEVRRARAIVEEFEAALREGIGAIRVEGQMVDAPVYERAKQMIERAG